MEAQMRIRQLRLKNGHKRFRDLTIDLGDHPARIVALVGPNGSGKSSVLDGILFYVNARNRVGVYSGRDYTYHSLDADPGFTSQNVEIDLIDGSFNKVLEDRQKTGTATTMVSFRSPYRYNSKLKVEASQATSELRLNDYGAGDAGSLDEKMELNYRRLYAKYHRYMQTADVRPSEARAQIVGELNAAIGRCLDLELFDIGSIEDAKGTLIFRKADHGKPFEFNVLSSGEKEVVDILLDLYLRRDDYSETIFLIDEPELHISTSIQRKLLLEIDRFIGPDCQIWVTTHSIGFIRALQNEMKDRCQIVRFSADLNLASTARTLKPEKPSAALWRDLFGVALDDLANLVSPKTIVYCEGRAESGADRLERGLDANVFNNVFAAARPDVLFVSSGGGTELDQRSAIALSIIGKALPDVEIFVLKDRDMASGKDTDLEDRRIYLATNPGNHRVLERWEIENYLYDRDVLRAYCAAEGLLFDEAAYDALVTDVVNQDLKSVTGRIKNVCGIKSSINVERFKLGLSHHLVAGMPVYDDLRRSVFESG
jgi:hypothetical protein